MTKFTHDHDDLPELLDQLDPRILSREEWRRVGAALKNSGYGVEVWDEWSRRDPERYHEGECAEKWPGFDDSIKGNTLAYICRQHGVDTSRKGKGGSRRSDDYVYGYDGTATRSSGGTASGINDAVTIPAGALAPATTGTERDAAPSKAEAPAGPVEFEVTDRVRELAAMCGGAPDDPAQDCMRQLAALFEQGDVVCFAVAKGSARHDPKRDKWTPGGAVEFRKVEDVTLAMAGGETLADVFGELEPRAGGWFCINPTDGQRRAVDHVTRFAHVLVECDEIPLEQQLAAYIALRLPVDAVWYSGGKSVHAAVRVDARDKAEFRDRVRELYGWLSSRGLELDEQNKDASRLCRLAGLERGGRWQRLIWARGSDGEPFEGCCSSWDEWDAWRKELDAAAAATTSTKANATEAEDTSEADWFYYELELAEGADPCTATPADVRAGWRQTASDQLAPWVDSETGREWKSPSDAKPIEGSVADGSGAWAVTDDVLSLWRRQNNIPSDPAGEVSKFLSALFEPDEFICTVAAKDSIFQGDDGRWRPGGPGMFYKRRIEYMSALEKYPGHMDIAFGTPNTEAGAWACINPLDGKGRKDENVTAFRYALVPTACGMDDIAPLRLPVAAIVSHREGSDVIVRVDAGDAEEYKRRVSALYDSFEAVGVKPTWQARRPSSLCRLPGYRCGDHWQRLAHVGPLEGGFASWDEWDAWRESSKGSGIEWNDKALAREFARRYGGTALLFNEDLGSRGDWMCWDGTRWVPTKTGTDEAVQHFTDDLEHEVKESGRWTRADQRGVEKYSDMTSARHIVGFSACHMAVNSDGFDQNPDLVNLENGTLDLNTLEVREASAADRITNIAGASYDPDADPSAWNEFLHQTFAHDDGTPDLELELFVQQMMGNTFAADNRLERTVFALGANRSGKGTFFDVMQSVFGTYAIGLDPDTLAQSNSRNPSAPSPDLADLEGKRLAVAPEPREGMYLDASLVKRLTGHDPIKARRLWGQLHQFTFDGIIWFNMNSLPKVTDLTVFLGDRIVVVPFDHHREQDERDIDLKRKLTTPETKSAVLNWLIEGRRMGRDLRFELPERCSGLLDEYQHTSDKIGQFIEARCVTGDPETVYDSGSGLYGSYKEWCEETGRRPGTDMDFYDKLAKRPGIERRNRTTRKGKYYSALFLGISRSGGM